MMAAFALVLTKPFSPYAKYLLNKEYIANELCVNKDVPMMHCNGKCHLAKMIKEQQTQEEKGFDAVNVQALDLVVGDAFTDVLITPKSKLSKALITKAINLLDGSVSELSHPPELAV